VQFDSHEINILSRAFKGCNMFSTVTILAFLIGFGFGAVIATVFFTAWVIYEGGKHVGKFRPALWTVSNPLKERKTFTVDC
jgi:hypothetical protein